MMGQELGFLPLTWDIQVGFPVCWLWPGIALAAVGLSAVNQHLEDLSFSAFQINKSF